MGFTNLSVVIVRRNIRDKVEDNFVKDIKNILGTSELEIANQFLLNIC
jgi:hypothetical protein